MKAQTVNTNKVQPMVQVICVTYNQRDYIRDALDSFVMQKTNFPFQVLVGDDCSTDGTSEIVAEYAKRYPEIIKHIHRDTNMGCLENFMDLCEHITAKYAAFCDGDDFWTDEHKLQKQFDYMEANEDVNLCCHINNLDLNAENGLYNWYKKFDFKQPFNTKNIGKKIYVTDIISDMPHMSTLFFRWNNFQIPVWAKTNGKTGDSPLMFLVTGDKKIFIWDEVMSTYRCRTGSVFYTNGSLEEHFLRTRWEYFKILTNVIEYFNVHYNGFGIDAFKSRLWTEVINYVKSVVKLDKWDNLIEIKKEYPYVYDNFIKPLLSEYQHRLTQLNVLGGNRANLLRHKKTLKILRPVLSIVLTVRRVINFVKPIPKKFLGCVSYWGFALVPKRKNLWVFSGFNKKAYMDNTKYLYEYIVQNHPEIRVVWQTKSKEVLKTLREQKMPVQKMGSLRGIWTLARAKCAIIDHYRVSDLEPRYGLNARTKIVQLWHGVGIKNMIPKNDIIPYTAERGVRLSSDILIKPGDKLLCKIKKIIKYPFIAPFRELFEKYHLIVCPGEQFSQYNATPWHVPAQNQFLCGYPRLIHFYDNTDASDDKYHILYAPTYRWKQSDEEYLVNFLLETLPDLHELLCKINGDFTIRLHPHTWRNYQNIINSAIANYPDILISQDKDIYDSLYKYSLMITDYSSIAYDFLITKKPILYFPFDIKTFVNNDTTFSMDYEQNCAGDIAYNWQQLLKLIKHQYENPSHNADKRLQILSVFTPEKYNSINNSERLVQKLLNNKD